MTGRTLDGRIALITGASKGLGKGMATALAAQGAKIVLVSRDLAALEQVAAEIREQGGEADALTADVTDEASVRELEAAVRERYGRIQILVNNAGVNIRKKVTDFSFEEWRKVLSTNLDSVFLMCRSFVPLLTGQGYGRIINMTSIMSHVSLPERTAYSASKAGLLGFTRALALELINDGVTVVGISPGPVATEMNQPLIQNPELNRQFLATIPMGRWGKVEEIGQLAAYICSEHAGFLTGTDIVIDGGWCAR